MDKNMEPLAIYRNGNYIVELYSDGTKIKTTPFDFFDAEFPDSMDIKITNYCDVNCPMCHEKSTIEGKHANLEQDFLTTLSKGTELAIGGGNPLSHPNFLDFLKRMKEQGVICNVTVNEKHFLKNIYFIQDLIDKNLIYGLGISLNEQNKATLEFAKKNRNVVFHLIIGIAPFNEIKELYNKNYKILLLGYKKFGRGESFYNAEIEDKIKIIESNIQEIFNSFDVVSFDNLALKQLKIKEKVDAETFERCFMGDDGEATMYVDLVEEKFAVSSTSTERFPLESDIKTMFSKIKKSQR